MLVVESTVIHENNCAWNVWIWDPRQFCCIIMSAQFVIFMAIFHTFNMYRTYELLFETYLDQKYIVEWCFNIFWTLEPFFSTTAEITINFNSFCTIGSFPRESSNHFHDMKSCRFALIYTKWKLHAINSFMKCSSIVYSSTNWFMNTSECIVTLTSWKTGAHCVKFVSKYSTFLWNYCWSCNLYHDCFGLDLIPLITQLPLGLPSKPHPYLNTTYIYKSGQTNQSRHWEQFVADSCMLISSKLCQPKQFISLLYI